MNGWESWNFLRICKYQTGQCILFISVISHTSYAIHAIKIIILQADGFGKKYLIKFLVIWICTVVCGVLQDAVGDGR